MIELRPLQPGSYAITVYGQGKSPASGDAYKAVLVLQREGDIGIVGPTQGDLDIADLRELRSGLAQMGLRALHIQRARGHRVPTGKLIRENAVFCWWEVRL